MIGPSRSAGARDALPRVRRCMPRRFFLLLLRTRSCALGAEVFSQQLLLIFHLHLLWMPVRLGPPYRRPILNATTSPLYARRYTSDSFAEMQSIRLRSGSNPRLLCLTNVCFGQQCARIFSALGAPESPRHPSAPDRILRLSVYLTLAFCDRVPSLRSISLVSV